MSSAKGRLFSPGINEWNKINGFGGYVKCENNDIKQKTKHGNQASMIKRYLA